MNYNLFAGLSQALGDELKALLKPEPDESGNPVAPTPAVQFPLLNELGLTPGEARVTYDGPNVRAMFKPYGALTLWSLYTSYLDDITDLAVRMGVAYPDDFVLLGGWDMDGGQVVDVSPDLINFMPDILVGGDLENPVYGPATQITDVNLLLGQAERDFS